MMLGLPKLKSNTNCVRHKKNHTRPVKSWSPPRFVPRLNLLVPREGRFSHRRSRPVRLAAWVLVGLLLGAMPPAVIVRAQDGLQAGPLTHEFPLTLRPGARIEALGPLLHYELSELWEAWALSPLLSYTRDRGINSFGWDFAYPLLMYDRFGDEYSLRFLILITFSGGRSQEEDLNRRTSVFPIFFRQASPDPALRYTAVVPLGGRILNRFNRDEIRFVLFPLYSTTRRADVVTHNYLFPIFHVRRGDQLAGWQLWPLVGFEERLPALRTNRFDEPHLVPGHRKRFVLWPIHFHQDLGIGSTNPVSHRILFPFYALERSPARDSSVYLWPLVSRIDDRGREYKQWGLPWPFVVFARGEGKTVNRVWPFYSQARSESIQSDFYLWPIYKYNRAQSYPFDRERTRILFFVYSHVVERDLQSERARQRWDLWPLYARRADREGNERVQILAPIESFLPHNETIQRTWAPLWSLWRAENNRTTGASSQSLLWNLYRRDAMPERQRYSVMFGLFQLETSPAGKRLRLFHIPLSRRPAAPETGAEL